MRSFWKQAPAFRALCAALAVAVLLLEGSGCGMREEYSGIEIGNRTEVSEAIRSAMLRRSYRVRISFGAKTLDRESLEETAAELMEDALYESEDPSGGDYLRFQYGGYRLTHSTKEGFLRYRYQMAIVPHYYTTAEQEEKVDEKIRAVTEEFPLTPESTDVEKIRLVHDFICDQVSYDTVHRRNPGSSHIQSTAYGALIYRTALCQGYAVLAYRLLKELGVETRVITGEARVDGEQERHAWNIVRVGDRFYHMDITLDDVNGSKQWFLRSEEAFSDDHTRDEQYSTDAFMARYPMSTEDYTG